MTMTPSALLAELHNRGVEPVVRDGRLKLRGPANRITRDLIQRVRQQKPALLAHLRAEQDQQAADPAREALALLQRLKAYTLPEGRMPAAYAIVERLRPLLALPDLDPTRALAALQVVERELVALGGMPDPDLAEAVALVERAFPGARLVEGGPVARPADEPPAARAPKPARR